MDGTRARLPAAEAEGHVRPGSGCAVWAATAGAPGISYNFRNSRGKFATSALQRFVLSGPCESNVAELLDPEIHSPVPSAKWQRSASPPGLRHDLPAWVRKYRCQSTAED